MDIASYPRLGRTVKVPETVDVCLMTDLGIARIQRVVRAFAGAEAPPSRIARAMAIGGSATTNPAPEEAAGG
jgi:hypothetical protein